MTTSPKSSTSAAARAKAIRRARARQLLRRLLLWVALPTLAAIIYYGLWAANEYESVVSFRIQAADARAIELDTKPGVIPATTAAPAADAELVREIIRSRAMLERLVEDHGLAEHYKHAGADFLSRLDEDAGYEQTFHYYFDKVEVSPPSKAGTLTMKIRAFSPDKAQALAGAIPTIAEDMLNRAVMQGSADRLALAEQLRDVAATRSERARRALQQLDEASEPHDSTTFAKAQSEADDARRAYDAAVDSVALTKLDRERKARYVVVVAAPSLPDVASYPKRGWGIATVFVLSLAVMGMISMLAGAVREHAKF